MLQHRECAQGRDSAVQLHLRALQLRRSTGNFFEAGAATSAKLRDAGRCLPHLGKAGFASVSGQSFRTRSARVKACDPEQHRRLMVVLLGHEALRPILAAQPRSRDIGLSPSEREQACGHPPASGTDSLSTAGSSGVIAMESVRLRAVQAGVSVEDGCESSTHGHVRCCASVVPASPSLCVMSCTPNWMPASPDASAHVSISASRGPAIPSDVSTCPNTGASTRSSASPDGKHGDDATRKTAGAAVEAASTEAVFVEDCIVALAARSSVGVMVEGDRTVVLAARSLISSKRRRALDRKKRSGRSVLSLGPLSPLMCLKSSAALFSSASNPGRNSRRKARICCSTALTVSRCRTSICSCCVLTVCSAPCKRSCN